MQRDMNLIRDILLAVEASDEDPRGMIDLDIPDRSKKEVAYHVQLLGEPASSMCKTYARWARMDLITAPRASRGQATTSLTPSVTMASGLGSWIS